MVSTSVWNPSQWGIRGQEDLGGGLRAMFDLGSTVILNTGAPASSVKYFDRNAFVGIGSSTWGALTLGRQVNTLAETIYVVDPLGARNSATNMNVRFGYLGGPGAALTNNFGPNPGIAGANLDRVDNSVKYSFSSKTYGLTGSLLAARGQGNGGNAKGAFARWDGGPVSVAGSWMEYEDQSGVKFPAYATGLAYRGPGFVVHASYIRNRIDSSLDTATKPYRDMTTGVAAFGVTLFPFPNLDLHLAAYTARRTQVGQPVQRATKFYVAGEYKLSPRSSFVLIGLRENFNADGAALDTGTPLPAGARSSNYFGAVMTHAF
jgi:predicted porin